MTGKDIIRDFDHALGQLRHAYMNALTGKIGDQKQFAEGLLAPQIAKLEKIRAELGERAIGGSLT